MHNKAKLNGFSLLEMLLVMVIITSVVLMMITYTTTKTEETKRDVTVMQYEQILNAGLAYYINNSAWPATIDDLKTGGYLPNKTNINNAWGGSYTFYNNTTTGTFSICSAINGRLIGTSYTSATQASIISGRLPMAFVASDSCPATMPSPATCASTTCAVVSTVNIPGQNLNNARSINFAGLYHNGACVPAPVCPNAYNSATNPTGMKPSIMVIPVSVSGNYYGGTDVYPLSSFTAFAVGSTNASNTGDPVLQPGQCTVPTSPVACDIGGTGGGQFTSGTFWRVCLDVVTEKGRIYQQTSGPTPWSVWDPNSGTIMAITRCLPNNEPAGSAFNVFQKF